jgi:hypothetical protein
MAAEKNCFCGPSSKFHWTKIRTYATLDRVRGEAQSGRPFNPKPEIMIGQKLRDCARWPIPVSDFGFKADNPAAPARYSRPFQPGLPAGFPCGLRQAPSAKSDFAKANPLFLPANNLQPYGNKQHAV